jgi:hypothetical protein
LVIQLNEPSSCFNQLIYHERIHLTVAINHYSHRDFQKGKEIRLSFQWGLELAHVIFQLLDKFGERPALNVLLQLLDALLEHSNLRVFFIF